MSHAPPMETRRRGRCCVWGTRFWSPGCSWAATVTGSSARIPRASSASAEPRRTALQRMLLDGQPLTIPAGDLERFADEICPALRASRPVVSSDGSFAPPEISAPELVLHATYGDATGRRRLGVGLHASGRRRIASRSGRAGPASATAAPSAPSSPRTRLADTGLERFGLVDARRAARGRCRDAHRPRQPAPDDRGAAAPGRAPGPHRRGRPASRPTTATSASRSRSRVSTAELAGERDWFDLGVTITVDGRELPFAEVFTALAHGEEQMLLPRRRALLAARAAAAVAARADRRGSRARRRAVATGCGSAATRRACGTSSPRSASSPSRRRRGSGRSTRCSSSTRSPSTSCPPTLQRGAAPLPARRLRLARVALGARARRHPRRRHGPRQDAAGARARLPRPRARSGPRPVPRRRADERRPELGRRGRPLRPRRCTSRR